VLGLDGDMSNFLVPPGTPWLDEAYFDLNFSGSPNFKPADEKVIALGAAAAAADAGFHNESENESSSSGSEGTSSDSESD